jgi:hypothetical protein
MGRLISTKINFNKMNKETRTFIWGILLVLVCGSGLAIHIIQLKSGMHYTWYEWILLIGCLYGTIAGGFYICKTIPYENHRSRF